MKRILEHIKMFATLTPELETEVLTLLGRRSCRKGDTIRGAQNANAFSYFLMSGSARVFYTLGGKEHTVAFYFADEFVLMSRYAVLHYPETVTIEFLESSELTVVPQLKMRNLLVESGAVADTASLLVLNTALVNHVSFLEERVHVMQSLSAAERFQWLISRYPRIMEVANITQIASYLGLTKETLYRIRGGRYPAR